MKRAFTFLLLFLHCAVFGQTLPDSLSVDWTLAGLRDTSTLDFTEINMKDFGLVGDGSIANDSIFEEVISSLSGPGAILRFPEGNFLFHSTIRLPDNVIIKGEGADQTTFTMDLSGQGHAFNIEGFAIQTDSSSLQSNALKDSSIIQVMDSGDFEVGNWIKIVQIDTALITSTWAKNSVGQIARIKNIYDNHIVLESPLRIDFDMNRSPYIVKINPVKNVGIECLKIFRVDDTAPQQSSNINFSYAVNCWVKGIESENCTFSHIEANNSSNIYISKCYFHHAFSYGGGGRAYGVMVHFTSNECLIENNVFQHLRHSMILQSGANGNVFAYNYSFDPYWETMPNDAAGDLVLHGNYVYANLFEQNICQNIVIDNSHGPNGPNNTIFRNRANGFGILFSSDNSPNQNILGNEITNEDWPYYLVNYTIQGSGHFLHGNNVLGTIKPEGTDEFFDTSYAYQNKPDFIPTQQWGAIGTPNNFETASIPAFDEFVSGSFITNACGQMGVFTDDQTPLSSENAMIFPNPFKSFIKIESSKFIQNLIVYNSVGKQIHSQSDVGLFSQVDTQHWKEGIYFIRFRYADSRFIVKKIMKLNSY